MNHFLLKNILSCLATFIIICFVTISAHAEHNDGDCTVTHGDYLGENYIFVKEQKDVYVLGDGLYMHASPDLKSEPIYVLEPGTIVELLDAHPDALMVSFAKGSADGEVTYIEGWVDARFVIESSEIYVAMHPTAVHVSQKPDAKIMMLLDTYDSLLVVEEYDEFYCVLLPAGVGYVMKESVDTPLVKDSNAHNDQTGTILADTSAYYSPLPDDGYTADGIASDEAIATVLDEGMEVSVLHVEGDWVRISFSIENESFGPYYIPSERIKVTE